MTHPSFEVTKTYRITVDGQPTSKALAHLERGVRLDEGMTSPAQVEVVEQNGQETILDITIHEGRYHQVKRMMLRVGYEVLKLVRIQMGPFSLADLHGQNSILLSADQLKSNSV
jgi:pseudouridine synthase